ncbi:cobyrinic acid a,c-diamide synthase [Tessaracoccus bendigoensis DSM 12906]|uniref:Hydrogenobyrinate a,c-diamide synthase n=1 Tax=Tessaracoccus bendigoensis DSM 12906 TaxID=1123357 RepID=A0A1M6LCD0_9ACTN|nr:cobyrinate a,c-diamide synthase [Tessaracoccus bendigoensis]SHJ68836.1 cobyrinic acid a,c-diamide synthase [Tessaracoccus bendigoensis DSM 12906]
MVSVPRVVIGAPSSGQGKTTVATGLMAALRDRGLAVAPFKVGPDYIDPGYHGLAADRPGRNLDPFLTGEELVAPLFAHGAEGADVAVVEGVMGLFDGRLGTEGFASTAHVAGLIDAPVVLVVDVRHTSRSIGALVHGMSTFDPAIQIAGVVINQVGSQRHEREVRDALRVPVLGALPRNLDIEAPSRHLGLVPAAERDDAGIRAMGETVARYVDLDAVLAVASLAPVLDVSPWDPAAVVSPSGTARPRIAIAGGRAFTFRYPETDELLVAAGCDPVAFDPLTATSLPEGTAGLWIGGGFPEIHAEELAGNKALLADIAAAVKAGLPTVAECAGLLYLGDELDGRPMAGALPGTAAMTGRLTMGYRTATSDADNLLGRVGEQVTGHEFHRTQATVGDSPAWLLDGRPDGVASPSLSASYLHVHWAGHPQLAQRFADAAHAFVGNGWATAPARLALSEPERLEQDLDHHGDRDLAPGLTDLAVNVRQPSTPSWLQDAITRDADWAAYPDTAPAREAIARYHGVDPAMVLPVAGAAEAFSLIARGIPGDSLIIHPQFTEPEAALLAAGRRPRRHLLGAVDGFRLSAGSVPAAELTIVGNPTNPTGVLHTRDVLLALRARVLVVDEAFLDAVPGEPETLIEPEMPGRLVLRSLTKTWALAGIRAGYVVGDPALIALLTRQQAPWSVSTPAIAAMCACLTPQRRDESEELARAAEVGRIDLADRLRSLGLDPVDGAAPFVLVDTVSIASRSLRGDLAAHGYAVRRGESFPGLGPTWLRLAVRDPQTHQGLVEALNEIKEEHAV